MIAELGEGSPPIFIMLSRTHLPLLRLFAIILFLEDHLMVAVLFILNLFDQRVLHTGT